jgi:hypothetical protein
MKMLAIYYQSMINVALLVFPRLFGCRKVTFDNVGPERSFQALKSLNANLRWEFHTPCDELSNYTYQIGNRLMVLIVEEWQPVRLVAPNFLIKEFQAALETRATD